jgi:hypothetical protein
MYSLERFESARSAIVNPHHAEHRVPLRVFLLKRRTPPMFWRGLRLTG